MNRARHTVLLAALCLAAAAVEAQEWRGPAAIALEVKGKPKGAVDGALVILRYQQISPAAGPRPVLTDSAGRAVLADLAEGVWEVEVSHDEYLSFVALVVLEEGRKPAVQTSFLQASGSSLTPIRVKFMDGRGRSPSASVPMPPEAVERLAKRQPPPPPRPVAPPPPDTRAGRRSARPARPVMPEPQLRPLPEGARSDARPTPPPLAQRPDEPQPIAPAPTEPTPAMPTPAPTEAAPEPAAGEPGAMAETATGDEMPEPGAMEPAPAPTGAAETEPAADATPPEQTPAAPPPVPPVEAASAGPPTTPEAEAAEAAPTAREPEITVPAPEAVTPTPAAEPPAPAPEPAPVAPPPDPMPPAPEPQPEPAPAPPTPSPEPTPSAPTETTPTPPTSEPAPPPPAAPAEPAPAAPVEQPATPAAPPAAALAAPGPLGPQLRAYRDRDCVECRPGEFALAVETVVGPATGPCDTAALEAEGRELAGLLGSSIALELQELAAPAAQAVGRMNGGDAATRAAELLGDEASACRLVVAVIPKAGRFRGLRIEAADASGVGDCQADRPCPVGRARWIGQPRVSREPSANVIWGLFVNEAPDRARRARLTVYFAAPYRAWDPPR